MLSVGHTLHQTMLPIASVEGEGLPDQDGGRHDTRTDAHPLVDTSEIEDHEEDEDCKQPAREDEEILRLQPLELNRLADTLVLLLYIGL